MKADAINVLEKADIRATVNRILVVDALMHAKTPMSLTDLETQLETLDKSSIFRVLTLLLQHDIVHAIEDGRGIVKYEMCHGDGHCSVNDMHAHFYCEKCQNVFCLEEINMPKVALPDGYEMKSINFMIKGICPNCK